MGISSRKRGQKQKTPLSARSFAKFRQKAEKTAASLASTSQAHIEENLIAKAHKIRDLRLLILEWSLMVLAIIVLALLQSVWFKSSYSSTAFVDGGSFVEGTLGEVSSLNPIFASTHSEQVLSRLLFATLTSSDYSGHIGPGLAESITSDASGQVWRARLRDGLLWSDGEPLTAEDVVFTVNLIQSPEVTSTYSSNLSGVTAALDKESENTIIFTLPSPYADFSSALTIPILPKHLLGEVDPSRLLEDAFSMNPVSSGAFRYNATQSSGNKESVIYLSRNPNYYGGTPLLDSFAIHTFSDTAAISSALSSGSITATAELPPSDAAEAVSSAIYEKQTTISSGVYLFMNTSSTVFKSRSARQAVQKGLSVPELREGLLGDEPALNYPILASQIDLTWPTLPAYDPAAAKNVLAPYAEQEVVLATVSTGYFKELGERIKGQLESLGLKVDLQVYDPGQTFSTDVLAARDYDLLLYEIELGADPDIFAYYHSSQTGKSGLNLSNYNDAITDDLIIAARSATDIDTRRAKYETFLTRWVENAPAIGIYQVNMSYLLNRNVRAFSEGTTLISPLDRFTDVSDWSATKSVRYKTP